jgi:hypothetical protein
MHYKLLVTAGPSLDETTHSCVHVNSETYVPVSNKHFEGQIAVRVKDFNGLAPEGCKPIERSPYFESSDTQDMTFSIEASGAHRQIYAQACDSYVMILSGLYILGVYKTQGLNTDDLLFGIVFRQYVFILTFALYTHISPLAPLQTDSLLIPLSLFERSAGSILTSTSNWKVTIRPCWLLCSPSCLESPLLQHHLSRKH